SVVQVAAGWAPSFGHGLEARSDGTVWAWGANSFGELGDGTTITRLSPVQVTGLTGVTQVAAGCIHSLALRSDGTVWAWGDNNAGQLGDGTLVTRTTPVRVTQLGTTHIAGAAAGGGGRIGAFTAILGTDGSVWAWGADNTGQLGNAPAATPATRPVNTIRAGSGITQIAAGANHMVALKADGTVLAWGDNSAGELGTATTTPVTGPVQVTG